MGTMKELAENFGMLAFLLLVAWVVAAGFGLTKMPGDGDKPKPKPAQRPTAAGSVWAVPVTSAPSATKWDMWGSTNVMG